MDVTRYYGTTNRLLLTDDWDIHLQKTGYILAAGYCMAMIVNINGEDHAIVMLHAPNYKRRAIDAVKAKFWVEYHTEPTKADMVKLDPFRLANLRKPSR